MDSLSKKKIVIAELESLPEKFLDELLSFVKFLQFRNSSEEEAPIHLASEQVLGKDWNTVEEDDAWKDL